MIKKRLRVLLYVLVFLSFLGVVSATGVTVSEINSSLISVSVTDASNMYAYEINFSYTGTIGSVSFDGFLGSDGASTTTGFNTRGGYLFVYEARLDNTISGISGNGNLFNISHDGAADLKGAFFIASSGSEESVDYSAVSAAASGTASGGGSTEVGALGTSVPVDEVDANVITRNLNVNIVFGKEKDEEIIIKNNGNNTIRLDISTEGLGDSVEVPGNVLLKSGEEKVVKVKIVSVERGLVVGKILFSYRKNKIDEVSVIVNTKSEDFLFDSSLVLDQNSRIIKLGDVLRAQLNLLQVGSEEKVDVVATYMIKDFSGVDYLEESENFFVDREKELVKEFSTENLYLNSGKYVLGVEIVYPGAFAISSTQFEVVDKGVFGLTRRTWMIVLVIGAVVVFIIFLMWVTKVIGKRGKSKVKTRRLKK